MSYGCIGMVECPDVQVELNQYFQTCNASRLREPSPFFDFLNSETNDFGYSQVVSPGNGKIRNVNLTYTQRILESEVNSGAMVCTATSLRGNCQTDCPVDTEDFRYAEEKMTLSEWQNVCKDNGSIFAEKFQYLIDGVMRTLATKITDEAAGLLGGWASDVTGLSGDILQVPIWNKEGTGPNPYATQDINIALNKSGWCGPKVIFGGESAFRLYDNLKKGCCADSGMDLSAVLAQFGIAVVHDYRVANAGANDEDTAWAIQPGALALVTWNQFDGTGNVANVTNVPAAGAFWSGVIRDPLTGFPLDVIIKHVCPNEIHLIVGGNASLCALPNDLFKTTDRMRGVTYFAEIEAQNQCAADPCGA